MIQDILEEKYGEYLKQLWVGENRTSLRLSAIVLKDEYKNSGIGTSIMNDLVNYAEKNGQIIVLTPSSDFGGDKNRLIQFYKRFGFKANKGQYKNFQFQDTMIRYPRTMHEGLVSITKLGAKKWNIQESTKNNIKRLMRENTTLEVTDETPDISTYSIKYNGRYIGQVGLAPVKEMKNTIEITNISINPREEFQSMKLILSVISSIWDEFKDVQRIILTPMPESRTFWHKMGAVRLNNDFLMINRNN